MFPAGYRCYSRDFGTQDPPPAQVREEGDLALDIVIMSRFPGIESASYRKNQSMRMCEQETVRVSIAETVQ
jgi:hypothetical protein